MKAGTVVIRARRKSERPPGALVSAFLVGGLMVSAALAALSVNSPNGVWLSWVLLIPLLVAIRLLPPVPAFLSGTFWGLCLFASYGLAHVESLDLNTSVLIRLALLPAVYAFLGSFVTRCKGFSPLLLGLGWVGVELALQPLGIRNGVLAGSLDHSLVVRTLGYAAGSSVVAFAIVYVNASILSMLVGASVVPGGSRKAPRSSSSEVSWVVPEFNSFVARFFMNRHARAPPTW